MSTHYQPMVSDPSLKDVLDLIKHDIFITFNCHAIAQITAVNYAAQTVQAKVVYQKTYFSQGTGGEATATTVDYAPLADVPFIVVGGAAANLTFPINVGDTCLVLFNDRDIDNWTQGQTTGSPNSNRLHSLADGIALIGLNKVTSYDSTRAVLNYGTTKVGVGSSKVLITNGTTLGTVLSNLITTLNSVISALNTAFALNATAGAPLDPAWASVGASLTSQLNSIQSQIGGLLE